VKVAVAAVETIKAARIDDLFSLPIEKKRV
jgi:hypothetical protein